MIKHLRSAADLDAATATLILDTAAEMAALAGREVKKLPTLRGRTVVNLFYEDSTRTRISFEAAAKRLSADVINFSAKGSSVSKGESLKDTALTLQAMGADAVVIRHSASGAPHRLASWVDGSVINAGDGTHEHPTQALLDAYTMRSRLGRLDGLKVAIVGDVLHSRVARSNVLLLTTLGAEITLVGPPTLIPVDIAAALSPTELAGSASLRGDRLVTGEKALGLPASANPADDGKPSAFSPAAITKVSYDLDSVLPVMDVVMMLRVQTERMQDSYFPSAREYSRRYGLDVARMRKLPEHAIVMHPGPMNRGMEIAPEVADSSRSTIVEQVANGVSARMAVLYLLLGGKA
ncbi:aspartate carbamoyltransferase catalytic subunit [Actinoplanes subtropicus]|uniref:aspartate carbamoyltransferase catalytic subunit n=1 Tax=Actinoplanes subtropicus TaxID=543632 RepID=UPI0004C2F315|nr:aspartate carbamoyltransferase catalytic subunit [Actinoplanes subtropicus]